MINNGTELLIQYFKYEKQQVNKCTVHYKNKALLFSGKVIFFSVSMVIILNYELFIVLYKRSSGGVYNHL